MIKKVRFRTITIKIKELIKRNDINKTINTIQTSVILIILLNYSSFL